MTVKRITPFSQNLKFLEEKAAHTCHTHTNIHSVCVCVKIGLDQGKDLFFLPRSPCQFEP